jgi:hypothetical protein
MKVPEDSSKFVSDAITGLNFLHNNPENGVNRVANIANSEIEIIVQQQKLDVGFSSVYSGANRTLKWDNTNADVFEGGAQSPIIGLAHELDHADRSVKGWETLYQFEAMKDTKSDAYNQSASDAYMSHDDSRNLEWEKLAIDYENFIGALSVNGNKISTYERPDYIVPDKQIKVNSIFSTGD